MTDKSKLEEWIGTPIDATGHVLTADELERSLAHAMELAKKPPPPRPEIVSYAEYKRRLEK